MFMNILVKIKIFSFSIYSPKSKCYANSNKLVVVKIKDETADVGIK